MYALSVRAHLTDSLLDTAFAKLETDGLLGTCSYSTIMSEYKQTRAIYLSYTMFVWICQVLLSLLVIRDLTN